jgi:hypothetical protein
MMQEGEKLGTLLCLCTFRICDWGERERERQQRRDRCICMGHHVSSRENLAAPSSRIGCSLAFGRWHLHSLCLGIPDRWDKYIYKRSIHSSLMIFIQQISVVSRILLVR